jgi:hypothetical protein
LKAAVIDLDGTMVDTADDFTASLNGMLAQLDAEETSREEAIDYVGKGSEHLVRSVLAPRLSADEAQSRFDEALALYQAEYAKINGLHTRVYPDVKSGLIAMRAAGLHLACVTNKPQRFAVELLEQHELIGYWRFGERRACGPRSGHGDTYGPIWVQPWARYTNDKIGWYSWLASRGCKGHFGLQCQPDRHIPTLTSRSSIFMFLNKKRSLSTIDRGAWPWRRSSR